MSKKSGKTVPSAETQKPSSEAETAVVASAPSVPERSPDSYEVLNGLLTSIPEDKLKMAEAAGIPVKPLLVWAATITQEMKAIKETLPVTVKEKLVEAINEAQQKQVAQAMTQTTPQAGGASNPLGSLGSLVQYALGYGGGGSDETTKWLAEIGKEQLNMSRIIFSEFAKRIVPDIYDKMAEQAKK